MSTTDKRQEHAKQLEYIKRRESQLWWLAIIVIILLAIAVGVINVASGIEFSWRSPFATAGSWSTLSALALAVILICAYFRDSMQRLRKLSMQLLEELQVQTELADRQSRELARLKDISDQFMSSFDTQEGLDFLLGVAMEASGAESACVVLTDDETGKLDPASIQYRHAAGGGARRRLNMRLAEWVVERGQPLMLDAGLMHSDISGLSAPSVSMLVCPMSLSGDPIGVLAVMGRRDGGSFSTHDLDAVSALAAQGALALEKVNLYRRLQEQVVSLRSAMHELKRTQDGLVKNEKLATIGQLAGGMAHEINNPLLTILGRAEMLLMDIDPASPQAKNLEIIRSETQRIAGLVRNLLTFSRMDRMGLAVMVDVNEVVERSLDLVAMQETASEVQVIRRLSSSLPPVYAEKGELQQVCLNLIVNAYQAMRETGGKLIVETSQDDAGYVVAKFADTGPGIAPEDLSRIFDPFFTTKPETEGTGLGLSVTRSIVEKYGGKIEVETRVGEGATFIVKLPSAEEASTGLHKAA